MSMWFGKVMDAHCFGECVCDCISTQKVAAAYAKEFLRRMQILRSKQRTLFAMSHGMANISLFGWLKIEMFVD